MWMEEFWLILANNLNNSKFISMKKLELSVIILFLFVSGVFAKKTIIVSNTLDFDRKSEMVEVSFSSLKLSNLNKTFVIKDAQGKEIGYQILSDKSKFIFQASVKAKSVAEYSLEDGTPTPVKAKTFGRFVPERKDDFAWENDLAAYRMYGPALAKENPSNGVDLWLKCTDELVVNKRYFDELTNGLSYHIDRGNGLDCYTVGHTLGVGGIAPYADGKLWVGNHFDHYKVSENGPLRTVFTLTYDSVKIKDFFLKQTLTITVNAGSLLNKGAVSYSGSECNMELAPGINLHDGKGNLKQNVANGTMGYAEDAVSNAKLPSGRNYVGVFVPVKVNAGKKEPEHGLLTSGYKVGEKFSYYFGGGWSKWGYPTDEDWFKALDQFALKTKNPLKVSVK